VEELSARAALPNVPKNVMKARLAAVHRDEVALPPEFSKRNFPPIEYITIALCLKFTTPRAGLLPLSF